MTTPYEVRRTILDLQGIIEPEDMARIYGLDVRTVKRILESELPQDWRITWALKKINECSDITYRFYLYEELKASRLADRLERLQSVAWALSDMEALEPYNCNWGHLRGDNTRERIWALEELGRIAGLERPPESWLRAREMDPRGEYPRGYVPYDIKTGTWGYRPRYFDNRTGTVLYERGRPIYTEAWLGKIARGLETDLYEDIDRYTQLKEERIERGQIKNSEVWGRLVLEASKNLMGYMRLKETWLGWASNTAWRTL